MIVSRTPLRISFAGGGSDSPKYFTRGSPGMCFAAAINKYMYISVSEKFDSKVRVCYSRTEEVEAAKELEHELIRETLGLRGIARGIEIHSCADVPSGTGLGSSSAFTVGLLQALSLRDSTQWSIAAEACNVELNLCKKPIGMQDQFTCALGGVRMLTFLSDGTVTTAEMPHYDVLEEFQRYLMLLYTGQKRQAGSILSSQQEEMKSSTKRDLVSQLTGRAISFAKAVSMMAWDVCGEILDESWQIKKELADGISNHQIDEWYEAARECGVWGGKICGAGGGGFLLLMGEPDSLRTASDRLGLKELQFSFDYEGTKIIYPRPEETYRTAATRTSGELDKKWSGHVSKLW